MNDFYISLPSNSSGNYFKDNTIAHFWTKLSHRIHLDEEWKVGLMEFSHPPPSTSEKDNRTRDETGKVRGSRQVNIEIQGDSPITIEAGTYASMKEMLDTFPPEKKKIAVEKLISEGICPSVIVNTPNETPISIPPGLYNSFNELPAGLLSECDVMISDTYLDTISLYDIKSNKRVAIGAKMLRDINKVIDVRVDIPEDTLLTSPPAGIYDTFFRFIQGAISRDGNVDIADVILQIIVTLYKFIKTDSPEKLRRKIIKFRVDVPELSPIRAPPNTFESMTSLFSYTGESKDAIAEIYRKVLHLQFEVLSNDIIHFIPAGKFNSMTELFQGILSKSEGKALPEDLQQSMLDLMEKITLETLINSVDLKKPRGKRLRGTKRVNRSAAAQGRLKRSAYMPQNIYVYTNIIKPQLVGDSLSRCLRIVDAGIEHHVFNPSYYFPVEKTDIENIEILLTDENGEAFPFEAGERPSILVLHFIKKT